MRRTAFWTPWGIFWAVLTVVTLGGAAVFFAFWAGVRLEDVGGSEDDGPSVAQVLRHDAEALVAAGVRQGLDGLEVTAVVYEVAGRPAS
jgi:hypothetical protein